MPGARVARGERVTLRTTEEEDMRVLQRMRTNPELKVPLGSPVTSRGEMESEWPRDDDADRFTVCLDEEGAGPGPPAESETRAIGFVTVEDASWRRPELGYGIVQEVHGEGYGREAVALAVDYCFRTYAHPAIGAGAFAFNDASRGLLESLGFSEEGRTRRDMFVGGEYRDMVQYCLLREEWESDED
ncbi:GNAT family N-acetyltransferase [Halomarina oriensis]|uniref:GNAT family N-acetyltransferase n=1 Tax=Halomarina oriensis TaxID=671145 RepID=A0A6B0GKA5_9EURY|nr:GNAT family protein [Halomarina oriensis]MWG35184.1 GNAT family N-acetyltransferase [Halomarina oriensis]